MRKQCAAVSHTVARIPLGGPQTMSTVTTRNVNTLPDGEHLAADNLYLTVRGPSRSFVFRYVAPSGVRRKMSLGSVKKISLADARAEADRCRVILAKGLDPKDMRDQERERLRAAAHPDPAALTLAEYLPSALEKLLDVRRVKPSTERNYRAFARRILIPCLGDLRIQELTPSTIAERLRKSWLTYPRATPQARFVLEGALDFSVDDGMIESNPARWRGGLALHLPKPRKVRDTNHQYAISLGALQRAMPALIASRSVGAPIAAFAALTSCRIGEVVGARWEEFDNDLRTWSIPPERRKDGRKEPHRVPLSDQARELIILRRKASGLVFPGATGGLVGRTTVKTALRTASGDPAATVHGLRSTFAQWAAESGVDFEVRETCLMHAVGNAVTRAYQRSDLLEKRREVLQAWADEILPPGVGEE